MSALADDIRRDCLTRCHDTHSSHIASCLSCADILAVLFADILTPDDEFILSKTHARYALESVCKRLGIDEPQGTQPYMGSLGHGLAVGCGMALTKTGTERVFVLVGDGELEEGSCWEALCFAEENDLPLTIIVDANQWQALQEAEDRHHLLPCAYEMRLSGHNPEWLRYALSMRPPGPLLLWCDTIKGKGVSFAENDNAWHYKSMNDAEYALAMSEVGA